MRILFLDFDGVLHPAGVQAGQTLPFEWVPMLARALDGFPEVGLVIHSTWREQFSLDYIQDFLEPLAGRFIDVAPPGPKAQAIQEFLDRHPEVEDALILDDQPQDVLGVPRACVLPCDPALGVSAPALQERLLAWLRSEAHRQTHSVQDAFSRKDSDRAAVLALAFETFANDDVARHWMRAPHVILGGQSPVQACQTAEGAAKVRAMLVALKHGGVV